MPPLYCPFPTTLHMEADALANHAIAWAQQFHLLHEQDAIDRFVAEQHWRLIARVYPDIDFSLLALIADWNTWGFYLDDLGDAPGTNAHPQAMQQLFHDILAVLQEQPVVRPEPLFASLHDIWQRVIPRSTFPWRERLRQTLQLSFLSYIWEATNRSQHVIPTRDAYLRMRVFTGAWLTYVNFLELAEHVALPANIQDHPHLQTYLTAVNNTIVWANDLVSFSKEQAKQDTHNLIIIVQQEQRCSLSEAIRLVVAYHNDEVLRCLALERDLPLLGGEYRAEIEKYIGFAHRFMRSNLDWAMESSRYQPVAIPLATVLPKQATHMLARAKSRIPHALYWLGGIGGLLISASLVWAFWHKKRQYV